MGAALAALLPLALAGAHIVTVDVTGAAPVIPGDAVQTERDARRDAFRNAIHAAASAHPVRRVFPDVDDELLQLTAARGFFVRQTWGPLVAPASGVGAGGAVRTIALHADIDTDALDAAVCPAVQANHDPHVDVAIDGAAGDDLAAGLARACFTVTRVSVGAAAVDTARVKAWVKASQSQHVVSADPRGPPATLVLVNTATGDVEWRGGPAGALDALVAKVAQRWGTDCFAIASRVELVLHTASGADVTDAALLAFLRRTVRTLEFAADDSAAAAIEVRARKGDAITCTLAGVDGGAEKLAYLLDEKPLGDGGPMIEVVEVTRGKLIARLHPPKPKR